MKRLLFLLVLFTATTSYGQCPGLVNANPQFCDLQLPEVGDLTAVDNGAGFAWFADSTASTPLPSTEALADGDILFLDNAAGNCGNRQQVTVTVTGRPTGANFQGLCVVSGVLPTVADLSATGNDVMWYDTAFGGSSLSPSTPLVDGNDYFADQSNPVTGCRTSRLSVRVSLIITGQPTGDSTQRFCGDTSSPTVSDLQASGNNRWYANVSSAVPLDPNLPLVDGEDYYATTFNAPCESSQRLRVDVILESSFDAGGDNTINYCSTDLMGINTIDLFPLLGGNPDSGGTWSGSTPVSGANGTINTSNLTSAGSPYVYTYTLASVNTCTDATADVQINITDPPNAGMDNQVELCIGDVPTDLVTLLSGNPDPNGSWTPGLNSGTGLFDPSIDPAGIYTYTVVGTGGCTQTDTANVDVSIGPAPDAGSDASIAICEDNATIDLFTILGGNPDTGGSWSPALNSGTGIFDPSIDSGGVYSYVVSQPNCSLTATATVDVNLVSLPEAGGDTQISLCETDAPLNLFDQISGNPDPGGTWSPVLNSGGNVFNPQLDAPGIYTYTVDPAAPCTASDSSEITISIEPQPEAGVDNLVRVCETDSAIDLFAFLGSNADMGGVWSPTLTSGTGLFDPATDPAGIYTYTVAGNNACTDDTASITVDIQELPEAGNDASISLCDSNNTIDLFILLGPDAEPGGSWSPSLNSGSGVFDPSIDQSGAYVYQVEDNMVCNTADSATVTVNVVAAPEAGVSTSLDLCSTDNPINLLTVLGGSPDAGGTWTPSLSSSSGVFDPALDSSGVYTYTVDPVSPCTNPSTATVSVTVNPTPSAGVDASIALCDTDMPIDLFGVLGGNPDPGGSWTPALNSGTGLLDPALDNEGVYTYTLANSPCLVDPSSQVTVTITPSADAGADAILDLCTDQNPIDLFTVLNGTPATGGTWSPSLASGTGIFDPAVDSSGIYTYTVGASSPCTIDAAATVTVSVTESPNAGNDSSIDLCENDQPVDLFTLLGGNPDTGGMWSPALNSGGSLFDPAIDAVGVYTYTVTPTSPCTNAASANVTVDVIQTPDAGTGTTLDLCESDQPVDLFTLLGGNPDSGGTWSPALASGSGIFNPAVDSSGIYTYTVGATSPCTIDATATITVSVTESPSAGSDNAVTLCANDQPVDLFTLLGGNPAPGGRWSPAPSGGGSVFDPSVNAPGIYTYFVDATAPCVAPASARVSIDVLPVPSAGIDGAVDLCENDNPVNLFNQLGGNPEPGGTWSPALSSGTGEFDPVNDAPGVYTYIINVPAPCSGVVTATVAVNVTQQASAGTDSSTTLCIGDSPINLFTVLGGNPDPGGSWNPSLPGGVFDPASDAPGVYTYTVSTANCTNDNSAVVSVTVIDQINIPNASLFPEPEICLGSSNTLIIESLDPLPDGFYDFEIGFGGANPSTIVINLEVINGETFYTIPAGDLLQPGTTTVTIIGLTGTNTTCGIALDPEPQASFDIIRLDAIDYPLDATAFCEGDNPRVSDLSANIPDQNVVWFDAATQGNELNAQDELVSGNTYYAEALNDIGCRSLSRVPVTVLVEPCDLSGIIIPDGFSPNGDGINDTFNIRNLRSTYSTFSLEIYNRDGYVVYSGNQNSPDWDGRNQGASGVGSDVLAAGVYFYVLDVGDDDPIQGRVYLNK